jgi:hypothetical protein
MQGKQFVIQRRHTVIQFDLELASLPLTLPFPSPLPTTGFLEVIMKVIRCICRTQFSFLKKIIVETLFNANKASFLSYLGDLMSPGVALKFHVLHFKS